MMKKILLISIVLTSLSTFTPITIANDSMSLRICEYVQANDKQRLRKFLKQKKVKVRSIYKDLRCNGDNILIFAAKSKALDLGDFLIGQLPSKVVAAEIDNLSAHSAHLTANAKERIK